MAIIQCSECASEISDNAFDCPLCGAKLKKPKRSVFGQIIKWTFILFNGLMIWWMFASFVLISDGVGGAASDAEMAGNAIGGAIGIWMIMTTWVLGDIILGMFVLFTRPKK